MSNQNGDQLWRHSVALSLLLHLFCSLYFFLSVVHVLLYQASYGGQSHRFRSDSLTGFKVEVDCLDKSEDTFFALL